jgi:serine/threonine protein kinase
MILLLLLSFVFPHLIQPSTPAMAKGNKHSTFHFPGYSHTKYLNGNSKVFLCKSLATNISYVCKLEAIPPGDYHIPIEILVFKLLLAHPHESLISMHELVPLGYINNAQVFVVVMDYYAQHDGWMDLFKFIGNDHFQTNISTIHIIYKKVVDGVLHLLNLGISHSDIKRKNFLTIAENILINPQSLEIKIIDFDLAMPYILELPCNRYVGTSLYLSPEIVNVVPYNLDKNLVWQLGCLLYALYFQEKPFKDNFDIRYLDIKISIALNSQKRQISKSDSAFLAKMLSKKEKDRPTLFQVSNNQFRS